MQAASLPTLPARLLPWFKARAKGIKGAFDPDAFAAALPHLPGWRIEATTSVLPLSMANQGTLETLLRRLRPSERWRAGVDEVYLTDWNDSGAGTIRSPSLPSLPIEVSPLTFEKKSAPRLRPDAPVPGTLYVSRYLPPSLETRGKLRVWHPTLGVQAWRITSPEGGAFLVLDKPRARMGNGEPEPLTPDSFWKHASPVDYSM